MSSDSLTLGRKLTDNYGALWAVLLRDNIQCLLSLLLLLLLLLLVLLVLVFV